ncbi:MAG: hypothetical protein U0931_20020 [Vulcanimicrobiota bacterium]
MRVADRTQAPTLRAVAQSIPNKPQHSMSTLPPSADIEGYAGQVVAETLPVLTALSSGTAAQARQACSDGLGRSGLSSATKLAMGVLMGGAGLSLRAFSETLAQITQGGMTDPTYPQLQQEAGRFLEQPMFFSETPGQQFNQLADEIGKIVADRPDADLAFLVAGVALAAHTHEPLLQPKPSDW